MEGRASYSGFGLVSYDRIDVRFSNAYLLFHYASIDRMPERHTTESGI